jgi:DNA-binding FadR family transcriptional regulator
MQKRHLPNQLSEFLKYLACDSQDHDRIPSLTELSRELTVSVASLREQMEVARSLGIVEIRPKTGIKRLPFSFRPAVEQSLAYAIASNAEYFLIFADFRRHVEAAYWYEAVACLNDLDKQELRELIVRAQEKLRRTPVQIPQAEHRQLHLKIYNRLNNIFVMGILESYWDLYEAVGLDVYTDLNYLQEVWAYHQKMVEAIQAGDYEVGYQALTEHMDLLNQRNKPSSKYFFE